MPVDLGFKVATIRATPSPQTAIYLALHNDYCEDYVTETRLPENRCGEVAVQRLLRGNRGHWGPLETPSLTLAIRADHNTMMQLRTHRIASFDYQSMRYTGSRVQAVAKGERDVNEVFYCRPAGHYRDRQGDPYTWTTTDQVGFLRFCLTTAEEYHRLREKGISEEQARGVLATNYFQNGYVTANLRSWLHILDMRLKADAQFEITVLMELVAKEIAAWVPEIFQWYSENRLLKAKLAP